MVKIRFKIHQNFTTFCSRNIETALEVEILGAAAGDEEDDEDDIVDETDRFN